MKQAFFLSACAFTALPALLAGCSAPDDAVPELDNKPGANVQSVSDYIVHVQPKKRKITLHRLSQAALDLQKANGPGLSPQAMIDANLQQDNVAGSGPTDSVELVTDDTTIEDTFGTAATTTCPANGFCADVTLNSFWSKTLNFTYAQVTSITDNTGMPLSGHSATNSDNPNNTGLDATFGLWLYQSPSIIASNGSLNGSAGAQGVMLPGAANGALKRWKFANPDDADTYIQLKVSAATQYSGYNMRTLSYKTNPSFVDACTVGANEVQVTLRRSSDNSIQTQPHNAAASYVYITLPFDFTFYGTRFTGGSARVNYSSGGNVSLTAGAATGTQVPVLSSVNNTTLPSSAPRPGLFPWWDQTAWGASPAGMCAKLVYNATSNIGPNRQLVIGWKKLAANNNGSTGPYVDFNVTFNESTEEIWFNYGSVTTGSGGGSGSWSATIGAQSSAGVAATGSRGANVSTFPPTTTSRYVLQPLP